MRVAGRRTNTMVKVRILMAKEADMLAHGEMDRNMGLECTCGRMEPSMKASG